MVEYAIIGTFIIIYILCKVDHREKIEALEAKLSDLEDNEV